MKKAKRLNLFLLCVHCIVFCLNISLGINIGFIIDTWLQPVLTLIPGSVGGLVGFIIALASGGLIGVGAYGLFIESERAWKVIWNTSTTNAEARVRTAALILVNLIWIGVGILGLAYRLQFLNQHGVIFLFWIGVLLECSQPLFGLVLYPMKHRPAEMVEDESLESFRAGHVENLYQKLESLPIHKRHSAYEALRTGNEGDVRDILREEVEEEEQRRRTKTYAKEQQKEAKRNQKKTRIFTMPSLPFANAHSTNQAERMSQNGKSHLR